MFHFLKLFVSGFCIGTADLVPGISGGTIALLLGLYDELIGALCTLKRSSLLFLLPLVSGIGTALLTLSPVVHFLLETEWGRAGLFYFFLGLTLGSIQICLQRTPATTPFAKGSLLLGILLALAVVFCPVQLLAEPGPSIGPLFPFMILAGMLAITAMLLPGISGSYMLVAIGTYPLVIKSLSHIVEGFPILLSVGIGIGLGAILCTPLIRWGLRTHGEFTHALLIGFMIGSLPAVWPGWVLPLLPLIVIGFAAVTFLNSLDNFKRMNHLEKWVS